MTCDGVQGLLSAYLDGELSPGELLRVERHLRRCHVCADEGDSLRQTAALVAGLEEVELPVDFHAKLHHRLVALGPPVAVRPAASATAWQRHLHDWALPAAAAAAVLVVSLASFNRDGNQLPPGYAVSRTATIAKGEVATSVTGGGAGTSEPATQPRGGSTTGADPGTQTKTPGESAKGGTEVEPPQAQVAVANPAALGSVVPSALSAHTVSYVKDLPAMQTGAKKNVYRYSFSAKVVDPAVTSAVLMAKYGSRAEAPSPTELTIRVPAAMVATDLAVIKKILGPNVTENEPISADLAPTIQRLYSQLSVLDSRREQMVKTAATAAGSADVAAAVEALDQVKAESDRTRADYDQVMKRASEATIVVVLEKSAQ